LGLDCKILVNNKFVVKFPLEKSNSKLGSRFSRNKPIDITEFIKGKISTQDIEI